MYADALVAFALAASARIEEPLTVTVVDAHTRVGLDDVTVELWTEDDSPPLCLETRLMIGVTRGERGQTVFPIDGGVRPDKARLSAQGRASRTVAYSELWEEIELYPAEPLVGRLLDLEDQPVAGAIVRTRETCRHAIPASQTRTDEDGRFVLVDCPASEQHADLEIVPREHVPCGPLDVAALRRLARRDGSIDIRVPRRAPRRLRLIDAESRPLAHRRIVSVGELDADAWTDAQGRCELPPPECGDDQGVLIRDPWGKGQISISTLPRTSELVLTLLAPSSATESSVEVTFGLPIGARTDDGWNVVLYTSDGVVHEGRSPGKVAAGPALLLTGRDFTPWVLEERALVIGPDANGFTLTRQRSREVGIHLPESSPCVSFAVQAGPTASTWKPRSELEVDIHVPLGEPLVVVADFGDGSVRRARIEAPTVDGAVIDLRPESTLVRKPLVEDGATPR